MLGLDPIRKLTDGDHRRGVLLDATQVVCDRVTGREVEPLHQGEGLRVAVGQQVEDRDVREGENVVAGS